MAIPASDRAMTRHKYNMLKLATVSFLFWALGAQAQIVYELDRALGSTGTVKGTIVTDGTIGPLTPSNILSWSFVTNDGLSDPPPAHGPIAISSASGGGMTGNAWAYFSATESELLFDFDGAYADESVDGIEFFGCDGVGCSVNYGFAGFVNGKMEQLVHFFDDPIPGQAHYVFTAWEGVQIVGIVDQDGDGVKDLIDNCPTIPNADQANYDGDAFGDACDTDDDNDGVLDTEDLFPFDPTESVDTDGDGIGNNSDSDDDNDNVADIDDNCPLDANEFQEDFESDGIGDVCDPDDDNDGVADLFDQYPTGQFDDALTDYWAFRFIEAVGRAGITGGCGNNNYCPEGLVTRAQMAVFLERGMRGSEFTPDPAAGNVFLDVAADDFAADFIEQLFIDGISSGCGNNNYCPNNNVTRAQMAVFLLRAKFGASYTPPQATGVYIDVPLGDFAVDWIEQLAAEGISGGCGNGNYCPNDPVTRAQMAVFLARAFGL